MKIRSLTAAVGALLAVVAAPLVITTPSDAAVETIDETSWDMVMSDGFNGTGLDTTKWGVYSGGIRRADNVIVHDGMLTLRTRKTADGWTAGGVTGSRRLIQSYGRYEIRARLQKAQGTRAVALLWPSGGVWPPEVDFYEIDGRTENRDKNVTTNHYSSTNQMQHTIMKADFSRWQRVGVVWTPDSLKYFLNGNLVGTQTGQVPSREMWLGLQTAIGTGTGAPDATTPSQVDFDVDWVRVYKHV